MRTFIRALLDLEDAYASWAPAEYAGAQPLLFCLWVYIAINATVAFFDCTLRALRALAKAQRRLLTFCLRPALIAAFAVALYQLPLPLSVLREAIGV